MEENENAWVCPSCGHENAKGKFCEKCGSSKTGEWNCSKCGHTNDKSKFCTKCGSPRCGASVPASTQPEPSQNYAPASNDNSLENAVNTGGANGQNLLANKNTRIALGAIVAIILLYFGYNFYVEKNYESKCESVVAVMKEANASFDEVRLLQGDAAAEETKNAAAKLKEQAEKMTKLRDSMQSLKVPDGKDKERNTIVAYLDKEATMLDNGAKILEFEGLMIENVNPSGVKKIKEIGRAFDDSKNTMIKLESLNLNGEDLKNLFEANKLDNALVTYWNNKEAKDETFYAEKKKEYKNRRDNENKALRAQNELVFIPYFVDKSKNGVRIAGNFYNGTDSYVTGIQEISVNLTLKCLDETVYNVENYIIRDAEFKHRRISPHSSTWFGYDYINIPVDKEIEAFDNFTVSVHDIKYTAEKR